MGCSSLGAAVKGDRAATFAHERKLGDGMLDSIAGMSKAVQQKKAKLALRRERGRGSEDGGFFAKPEEAAEEALWWSGDQASTVKVPKDWSAPFERQPAPQESDSDGDEYHDDDYYDDGGYNGNGADRSDGEGPMAQLPEHSNSVSVTSARPKAVPKPPAGGKSPWDDSSGEDEPSSNAVGSSKKAPKNQAPSSDTDDSAAKGRSDAGAKRPKSNPKKMPKKAASGLSSRPISSPKARPPSTTSDQESSGSLKNSSTTKVHKPKAKPKARSGPRTSEGPLPQKSAALQDSSDDDDGGKVMF